MKHLVFLAAALSAFGCGTASVNEVEEANGSSGEALIGGIEDPAHKFSVGVCAGPLSAEGPQLCQSNRCTGTLIAPNLVLTARHCVHQQVGAAEYCDTTFSDTPVTPAGAKVTLSDSTLEGDPKWISVAEILVPSGNKLCQDDLALLVLSNPVALREAFPVFPDVGRSVPSAAPKAVAIVSRGVIAEQVDLSTGQVTRDVGGLRRRFLENIPFTCATHLAEGCTIPDFGSPPSNQFTAPPTFFVIGASTAAGDSGSGVFDQATFRTSFPRLIGVTNGGTYGPDGKNNHSLITRLDIHRDFILGGYVHALTRQ